MFTEITKREFKARFGRAFWRVLKEHDDKFLFRGYMQNKRERERWGR
jgi:hypothetical protein